MFTDACIDILGEDGHAGRNADGTPNAAAADGELGKQVAVQDGDTTYNLHHGSVVIAAITKLYEYIESIRHHGGRTCSKESTSARSGCKPWVKTSLAPGSKVVVRYLEQAGLLSELEALKFHLVGFGCTTCITATLVPFQSRY